MPVRDDAYGSSPGTCGLFMLYLLFYLLDNAASASL
jgi:hypothetical protein